jgi:hypothetical protein
MGNNHSGAISHNGVFPVEIYVEIASYIPQIYGEMLMLNRSINKALKAIDPWKLFTDSYTETRLCGIGTWLKVKCRKLKNSASIHGRFTRTTYKLGDGSLYTQTIWWYKYGFTYKREILDFVTLKHKCYSTWRNNKHGVAEYYKNSVLVARKWYRYGQRYYPVKEAVHRILLISSSLTIIFATFNLIYHSFK